MKVVKDGTWQDCSTARTSLRSSGNRKHVCVEMIQERESVQKLDICGGYKRDISHTVMFKIPHLSE